MNQDDKRRLENQLLSMGLPALEDPALIQVMADMVNGYPIVSERVQFFCDLLNECDAGKRYEMYNAIAPKLHFEAPSFPECETRITAKAERMVGRRFSAEIKPEENQDKILHLKCFGCEKQGGYVDETLAGCMLQAKKNGWGRGPIPGHEYCAECRMNAMLPKSIGPIYTRRHNALDTQ